MDPTAHGWLVVSPMGLDTYVVWHLADLKSNNECLGSADGEHTWVYLHNPQDLFTVYDRAAAPRRTERGEKEWGCPLWVKSRHMQCTSPCPLCPQKRHQLR